jgi:CRISPR-associated exonuclease Cas4
VDRHASERGQKREAGESDLIPLSALQHYLFCPRQCALIHVEQVWSENALTAEGRLLHERTAEAGVDTRRGVRTVTAMPVASRRLGVSGVADVVEMHGTRAAGGPSVEYKRGRPRRTGPTRCSSPPRPGAGGDVRRHHHRGACSTASRGGAPPSLDAGLRRLTEEVAAAAAP